MTFKQRVAKWLNLVSKDEYNKVRKLAEEASTEKRKNNHVSLPNTRNIFNVEKGVRRWEQAIQEAIQAPSFQRYYLYEILERCTYDAQVFAQMNTRISGVMSEEYIFITEDDAINEEVTKLFRTPAFESIIKAYLNSKLYGVAGIELTKSENGRLQSYIISHYFLNPEKRLLLPYPKISTLGVEFEKIESLCVFDQKNLGLLTPAARYALYKEFSVSDWSLYCEKFGMPHTVVKTNKKGQELANLRSALQNFGANAWMIIDMMDEFELMSAEGSSTGFQNYLEMIKYCNEEISKILVGQTGTADEKAHVGAANVHMKILNWHVEQDMIEVRNAINDHIKDKLVKLGLLAQNLRFEWKYFHDKRNFVEQESEQIGEKEETERNEQSETAELRNLLNFITA